MTSSYIGNSSLADRFRALVKDDILPAEAPELLFDLYVYQHFHLISDLLKVREFRLDDAGKLEVELSDGSKPDPETVPTRDPYPHEQPTMVLDTVYGLHRTRTREKRWQAAEQEEMERRQAGAPRITPPEQPDPLKPVIPGGHGGHNLDDLLLGWRRNGLSLPRSQEHLAALIESGDIVTDPQFDDRWRLCETGQTRSSRRLEVISLATGEERYASQYDCYLSDPRLLDPRFVSAPRAPAVVEDPPENGDDEPAEATPEPVKGEPEPESDANLPSEGQSDGRERSEWKQFLVPLLNTMRDENQIADKNAAFRVVQRSLAGRGLTMSRGSIYEGLTRYHAEWCKPAK